MPTFMGHHSALKEKLKFCQTAKTSDLILQGVKISLLVASKNQTKFLSEDYI